MSAEDHESSVARQIKNQILENQQIIDELNRKTREVRIIQEVASEMNSSLELDTLLHSILESLDRIFEFRHSMVLLLDESGEKLKVTASHGYENEGVGAEIAMGQGVIGVVAKRRKIMRMGNISTQMAYTASVRTQFENAGQLEKLTEQIPLPGLPNVQSQVAIPLMVKDRLIGVLAVESAGSNVFDKNDELLITILSNQAASAIDNARLYADQKEQNKRLNEAHVALKKLNDSLEEKVTERTAELRQQKELVEHKNKEVLDSITYAKRIQNTILPAQDYMKEHLEDFFVYYRPKDIVSGDFYWVNKKDDQMLFAAIDCTGHGVPGALVSIVAHSNLQRAVTLFGLRHPAEILDKLNESVMEGFNRHGEGIRDGMDIALCALNRENRTLEFSGANNSLYIFNDKRTHWPEGSHPLGEGIRGVEVKGDKQPIGYYENNTHFTNHSISLESGDRIYVFSDGYADQFGGPNGKKLTRRRFKELLEKVFQQPSDEQKAALDKAFHDWKGQGEQVDDILVMGIGI